MSTIEIETFEFPIERRRTTDIRFVLWQVGRTEGITLAETDQVRLKLGARLGQAPLLDLNSETDTANDSGITIAQRTAPAEVVVRFAEGDTATLAAGWYHAELAVVDDSETAPADATKCAGRGMVEVVDTMLGEVGLDA